MQQSKGYAILVFCVFILANTSWLTSSAKDSSVIVIEDTRKLTDTIMDIREQTKIVHDSLNTLNSISDVTRAKLSSLTAFQLGRYINNYAQIRCWLKFEIENKSDTSFTAYYYCGKYNHIQLLSERDAMQEGGMCNFSNASPAYIPNYYFEIFVPALTRKTYYVSITNYGILSTQFLSELHRSNIDPAHRKFKSQSYFGWLIFSCLLCGATLMMSLMFGLQFVLNRRREFLFYSLYVFSMFLNLERASEWNFDLRLISSIFHSYYYATALIFNLLSGIFYLLFTGYYFEFKTNDRFMYNIIRLFVVVLSLGLSLVLLSGLFHLTGYAWYRILSGFKYVPIVFSVSIVLLVLLRVTKSPLLYYYAIGYLMLIAGALINILLNNFPNILIGENVPRVVYLALGFLVEVCFFGLGIGYKTRRMEKMKLEVELENLKLEQEHQLELLQIRNKLSRDLHDEIGSTVSSINILSKSKRTSSEEMDLTLKKINDRSQRLMLSMKDIIWNVNPENDSFEDLLSRMREFATSMLEAKNLQYSLDFPKEDPPGKLNMHIKSNLYLIFKEAINNLCKHADATHVVITLHVRQNEIEFSIKDNGVGFDIDKLQHISGLGYMKTRADEIGAEFHVQSSEKQGCSIVLRVIV